jgi:hypothetical protein
MPHASRPSRCDAQRARSSSNDKDPPRDTRRARILDDIEAILDASSQRLQTCNEWHLDEEFAEYHWSLPRDEDYYLLLEDCKEKYHVLKTGPCPCTFGEVLRTSGPSIPPYMMSVERLAHTGEIKFHCPPSPLSPCTNAPSSESACDVRENDNASSRGPSSIRDVRGPWPRSRNTTSEQSTAHSLPTGELRLSSLARKARIAFRAHPYAGARPNEWKRCLIATEPAEPEGLDANAKSSRREGLDTDAKSLRREGLEADIKALCREQVTLQPGFGEASSSMIKRPLEEEAINNELKVSKRSPVTETALTPPRLPAPSVRATFPRQNDARLITKLGVHMIAPKETIIWPGVDPPSHGKTRPSQPPDEAPSTTLRLENEPAVSNEETSARKHAPIAKTAPTLPDHLPTIATRAAPARPTKNESKPPPPVVSG